MLHTSSIRKSTWTTLLKVLMMSLETSSSLAKNISARFLKIGNSHK